MTRNHLFFQERNLNHADGGPEASRVTAAARRKLGTLGSSVDTLRASLESAAYAHLTENERNRRRDLVAALRNRREQMLQALKRSPPQPRGAARTDLLSTSTSTTTTTGTTNYNYNNNNNRGSSKETDLTAELDNTGLVSMQRQVMQQQDDNLGLLERSVQGTKHIALQINEEATLQNRLLEEFDEEVDVTQSRLRAVHRKAQWILNRSSGFKMPLVICMLSVFLMMVVLVLFKIAVKL